MPEPQYEVNGRSATKELDPRGADQYPNIFKPQSSAPTDGVEPERTASTAVWSGYDADWRVKLGYRKGSYSGILSPLEVTGGVVFPYTPTVIVNHTANYDAMHPVHSNYPFYAYQNSQVDQMTITGDFVQQTEADAEYWVAVIHFLRSATKMAYGETSNQGNPPPLLKLNGYGQFVFNDVPVVLSTFMVDLPADVDYIETSFGGGGKTFVPTKCQIALTLMPQYSRRKVETFSLDKFVNGGYLKTGGGFI
jgi:hypothetical protein